MGSWAVRRPALLFFLEGDEDVITQKTKITNLKGIGRSLTWVSKGQWLAGYETVIVEGAYPTACKTPGAALLMEAEVRGGLIKVALISELPVESPEIVPSTPVVPVPAPTPKLIVAPKAKVKVPPVEDLDPLLEAARNEAAQASLKTDILNKLDKQVFVEATHETFQDPISLDGSLGLPELETVPMFGPEKVSEPPKKKPSRKKEEKTETVEVPAEPAAEEKPKQRRIRKTGK
jgi:hypothetical protein